jgi:uncharacterized protein
LEENYMRSNLALVTERRRIASPSLAVAPDLSKVDELVNENTAETLSFLSARPVHTVVMTSLIRDNGIESPLNRGRFFGYRNLAGQLEGVALIGHSTLVEARTNEALKALAFTARVSETPIHLIMSSGTTAHSFWNYLSGFMKEPRLTCTELLFEVAFPFPVQKFDHELRPARTEELLQIAEAQAEVAEIESGVNPMLKDRDGFLKRVLRRIDQGRVFVVFEGDELVFKADIIAETDTVAYLEGVYVGRPFRGLGIGSKCLSALCLRLLGRVQNVCLLSNIEFDQAHRSFMKAGMRNTDACTTLFV